MNLFTTRFWIIFSNICTILSVANIFDSLRAWKKLFGWILDLISHLPAFIEKFFIFSFHAAHLILEYFRHFFYPAMKFLLSWLPFYSEIFVDFCMLMVFLAARLIPLCLMQFSKSIQESVAYEKARKKASVLYFQSVYSALIENRTIENHKKAKQTIKWLQKISVKGLSNTPRNQKIIIRRFKKLGISAEDSLLFVNALGSSHYFEIVDREYNNTKPGFTNAKDPWVVFLYWIGVTAVMYFIIILDYHYFFYG